MHGVGNFTPFLPLNWLPWQRPLRYRKKVERCDHQQLNTYHMVQGLWKLVQRILRYFGSERTSLVRHKIGYHGNVPWGIRKNGPDQENSRIYLPFGKKIVKIGPVDTEIALLIVKKEEINASKIYSPSGKFAERAKKAFGLSLHCRATLCCSSFSNLRVSFLILLQTNLYF